MTDLLRRMSPDSRYLRYFRPVRSFTPADAARFVAVSHHRRGVGGQLVHELARRAADAGITHLTATVLAENWAVLGLIRRSGWEVTTTPDGPYADIVVHLPPELVGATDPGAAPCLTSPASDLPGRPRCPAARRGRFGRRLPAPAPYA
ncbi:GNAT family N-acetyltransferase [Intrasporangium flavum]|uniref:GNAT family N-acetyltransferase n=1 Tax=Intrasporangium flavum TaxID=1428657 RepID=UPI001A95D1AC|nr:GNAT family N-acetyltransferase [Intrasporangium flavum]